MTLINRLLLSVTLAALAGCASKFTLVEPSTVIAAKSIRVQTAQPWNKAPSKYQSIKQEEIWTANGPRLDSVRFIGGLKEGQAIAKQKKKDNQKVPTFTAQMMPDDLVSMIEAYYRIKLGAGRFEVTSVAPRLFMNHDGLQIDADYVGVDKLKRRTRILTAIVDRRFYMMSYDAAALHYFDASLGEFDRMASQAALEH